MDSGIVIGTATGLANQASATNLANAYLGIPFAEPPVRFAPPTPPQKLKTPLKAHNLPPACLQQFGTGPTADRGKELFNNPGSAPPEESEDCLYLNVFAPQDANPKTIKPVMFWLFGGNLQFGTASLAMYNGSSLAANNDVVVVVPNYRTNFFGFSNSPDIPFGLQNSGFLDQRLALEWVQLHIRSFGGDPSKVTIFGESAGGYSVKQLLSNPPSPMTYHAAIMESQQTAIAGNGLDNYNKILTKFGCDTAVIPLECLRKVSGDDIKAYVNEEDLGFPPVDGDGTFSKSAMPSIVSGKFADVPIFIGTNKDEARIFLEVAGLSDEQDVVGTVDAVAGINISSLLPVIKSTYAPDIVANANDLIDRILTDLLFTCTTSLFSSAIQAAGRQPVWRYFYEAAFPDTTTFKDAGAYHSSEIMEVFGSYPLANEFGTATAAQTDLSSYMQGVWAGFAKDPFAGVPWPRLASSLTDIGLLGGPGNPAGQQTVAQNAVDYSCPIYDPILAASGMGF